MKHEDRRKEAGKMFIDIAKYTTTVGLIGGILSENISLRRAIVIFIIVLYHLLLVCGLSHLKRRKNNMEMLLAVLAAVLVMGIFLLIISYREDHPKKGER